MVDSVGQGLRPSCFAPDAWFFYMIKRTLPAYDSWSNALHRLGAIHVGGAAVHHHDDVDPLGHFLARSAAADRGLHMVGDAVVALFRDADGKRDQFIVIGRSQAAIRQRGLVQLVKPNLAVVRLSPRRAEVRGGVAEVSIQSMR